MEKQRSVVGDKAWKLLRSTLLWARKVSVLKRGSVKRKGIGDRASSSSDQIRSRERQLSFDRTPDPRLYVKKDRLQGSMRFLLPCVGSKANEFDYGNGNGNVGDGDDEEEEEEVDEVYGNYEERGSSLAEEEGREGNEEYNGIEKKMELVEDDEGIDSRAEKFIAEFYDQIRFRN